MKPIPARFIIPVLLAMASFAHAEVYPNALFSDHAVLQQNAGIPVWGTAGEGENVTVQLDKQTVSAVAKTGKWMVRLQPHKAGGPFTLTIAGKNTIVVKDVLVGEVWICSGQSNMAFNLGSASTAETEKPTADYPQLRMFTVDRTPAAQPRAEVVGEWTVCTPGSVSGFSAVGYFFGRDIMKATGAPVGMIHSSWNGTPAQTWVSLDGFEKDPAFKSYAESARTLIANYPEVAAKYPAAKADFETKLAQWNTAGGKAYEAALKAWPAQNQQAKAEGKPAIPKPEFTQPKPVAPAPPNGYAGNPTVLYNGMIAPLVPYAIKGAIWYQGESNNGDSLGYRKLFPGLIADWRAHWGQGDFPFLFVQIAPNNAMRPEIREAQLLTWQTTPNTGMAVITDVGDAGNIHPKQKEPVGARLALAARALAYGEKIEYSGPVYDTLTIDGNRAILRFKHIGGGLVAKDGALKGFNVAGADGKQFPAKAEIDGDTVVVTGEQVAAPVAVRYGWANVPDVNLFNREGIPATPFRTDTNAEK